MEFRKARKQDIEAVADIYADIHTEIEQGNLTIGWVRNAYPTCETAELAWNRGELFVLEVNGTVVGAAIINQQQVDVYEGAAWEYPAADHEVMVLHTLVISPKTSGNGYGKAFVGFYEEYALSQNCSYLRMDTNVINSRARTLYQSLGYKEIGIVPCVFNGIDGVQLVLLEKKL